MSRNAGIAVHSIQSAEERVSNYFIMLLLSFKSNYDGITELKDSVKSVRYVADHSKFGTPLAHPCTQFNQTACYQI